MQVRAVESNETTMVDNDQWLTSGNELHHLEIVAIACVVNRHYLGLTGSNFNPLDTYPSGPKLHCIIVS